MRWVSTTARELVGLFVDDGSLALALIAWLIAVAVVLPRVPFNQGWDALILFAGCIPILVENVWRTARPKRAAGRYRRATTRLPARAGPDRTGGL
jgi:hypothetical protein